VIGQLGSELLARRLHFVTGKGGVGKSTVAAALALLAAAQGKRVLAVEFDAKGDLAAAFDHVPIGFDPKLVAPGVHALSMDTEASLREYLRLNLKIPVFGRIGPVAKTFDFLAAAAPGNEAHLEADVPPRYEHLFRVGQSISGFQPIGGNSGRLLADGEPVGEGDSRQTGGRAG